MNRFELNATSRQAFFAPSDARAFVQTALNFDHKCSTDEAEVRFESTFIATGRSVGRCAQLTFHHSQEGIVFAIVHVAGCVKCPTFAALYCANSAFARATFSGSSQ